MTEASVNFAESMSKDRDKIAKALRDLAWQFNGQDSASQLIAVIYRNAARSIESINWSNYHDVAKAAGR